MTTLEKIRKEIERLKKEYSYSSSSEAKYRCESYNELLDFLDTMQEEKVHDDKGQLTGQTTIYKRGPIFDTADRGFSEWWNLYGKKIDRAKCERKWQKLTLAEKQACIAATPAYVASTPDLQYRRHPATYLNNKSWENQIIPRNNGTDKQAQQQQRLAEAAELVAKYSK